MSYSTRRILLIAIPMVFGFLIAQYLSGVWSETYTMALFVCAGLSACLIVGKFIRKIIYFPIKLIRRVLFRLW